MKRLYLLRHAKSSWDQPGIDDFDRPLAPRGVRAAKRLARRIAERGDRFDFVLCSAARRTKDTWKRIAKRLDGETPVAYARELYLNGDDGLMTRLRGLDDAFGSVLLVAHNPDIAWLAARLCGDGEAEALRLMGTKYPTGGLAAIRLDLAHWADLRDGIGYLESFDVPRALPD